MAKSFTKKSKKEKLEAFDILEVIAKKEFAGMLRNGLPPCIKITDTKYIVGEFNIVKDDNGWQAIKNETNVAEFLTFASAMVYCISVYMNNYERASQIKTLNDKIVDLLSDKKLYEVRLKEVKDDWKLDLFKARYTTVVALLNSAVKELEKNLMLGKYSILGKINL